MAGSLILVHHSTLDGKMKLNKVEHFPVITREN